jgi:hypothetical protein
MLRPPGGYFLKLRCDAGGLRFVYGLHTASGGTLASMATPEAATVRQKLTVALPVEDIAKLEELAVRWGNKTTALIRAVRTIHYLAVASSRGSKIMLHDHDGSQREVLLM